MLAALHGMTKDTHSRLASKQTKSGKERGRFVRPKVLAHVGSRFKRRVTSAWHDLMRVLTYILHSSFIGIEHTDHGSGLALPSLLAEKLMNFVNWLCGGYEKMVAQSYLKKSVEVSEC